MMRISVSLILVISCLACTRTRSVDAAGIGALGAQAPASWRDSAEMLNRIARDSGLVLTLWPRHDSVPVDATRFTLHEHACGTVLRVRTRVVPHDDSVADPERVVEFDSAGRLVRAWGIPVDEIPLAIQADELFVSYRANAFLGIKPNGNYRVLPKVSLPAADPLTCPTPQIFALSDFERCTLLVDLRTGLPRRLAYEGPCT